MRALQKAIRQLGCRKLEVIDPPGSSIEAQGFLATLPYWVGRSPVINMPTSLLVMQGAFGFNEQHPFVMAITRGRDALAAFYDQFQPNNLAQMYQLPAGRPGTDLPPWELPWLLRNRRPPGGEKGLGLEHGVSFYGPCTDLKIDLEVKRLSRLVKSIETRGYRPGESRHIEGHFLQSGAELKFFVRGGKHRAAALAALGFDHVPVRMRDTWPRLISRDHVANWPLVQSRVMSPAVAGGVFDRFFE